MVRCAILSMLQAVTHRVVGRTASKKSIYRGEKEPNYVRTCQAKYFRGSYPVRDEVGERD
jgi:hypothetical protein